MKPGSGKEEILKRLSEEGLPDDVCEGYHAILRRFLCARSTKAEFEMAIRELLPAEKIPVHNALIRELLKRALTKRDGAPEVPLLVPIKDKRAPPAKRAELSKASVAVPGGGAKKPPAPGEKRKPRDEDGKAKTKAALRKIEKEATAAAANVAAAAAAAVPVATAPATSAPASLDSEPSKDVSVPLRKPKDGRSVTKQSTPVKPVITKDTPTIYERMAFLPVRPGETIDLDIYLTLRQRMRRIAEEEGVPYVKDDGALLLTLALEIRIKSIMSETVAATGHKKHYLNGPYSSSPLDPLDMLLAADQFSGDVGIALQRLSLAVF